MYPCAIQCLCAAANTSMYPCAIHFLCILVKQLTLPSIHVQYIDCEQQLILPCIHVQYIGCVQQLILPCIHCLWAEAYFPCIHIHMFNTVILTCDLVEHISAVSLCTSLHFHVSISSTLPCAVQHLILPCINECGAIYQGTWHHH